MALDDQRRLMLGRIELATVKETKIAASGAGSIGSVRLRPVYQPDTVGRL
jgi:hypothetical protein